MFDWIKKIFGKKDETEPMMMNEEVSSPSEDVAPAEPQVTPAAPQDETIQPEVNEEKVMPEAPQEEMPSMPETDTGDVDTSMDMD